MRTTGATGPLGFEAFGTACGLAVVVGGLSLLLPGLATLTGTLTALAVAGWAAGRRRGPDGGHGPRGLSAVDAGALGLLAAAGALALWPSAPLGASRGLLLGLAVVPLWSAERARRGARR